MSKIEKKSKKYKSQSVRILPVSIIIFTIVAAIALYIVLNKGKIAGYSLVKIQTSSQQTESSPKEEEKKEDVMEIISDKKYLSSKKKETTNLTVTINGENVDLSEIELESSNEDVIDITDGVAKAISDGKSKITAKKDDLEASINLYGIIPIQSFTFTTPNTVVKVGKSLQMKLVAKPSDAGTDTLKYESSDESIATVNSNGIVTGVAPGTVTITVTDSYTELTKSLKLTIKK